MSNLTEGLSDLLSTSGGGRRETALVDASMAAAALVATAEGDVSFAERAILDQAIAALVERGETTPHDAVLLFDDFVEAIRANSSQGRRPALAALDAFDPASARVAEAATVVLRIAEAVAGANGAPGQAEIDVVKEIAAALTGAASL